MGQAQPKENKKRPVALLDVDHTLFFGIVGSDEKALELNINLIESLKKRNILDIYLFTDMTFTPTAMRERQVLIDLLEKKYGMCVHGVLTPCDITWTLMNVKEVEILETLTNRQGPYQGKFWGDEFEDFIVSYSSPTSCSSSFPQLSLAISSYRPHLNHPGRAWAEAWKELQESKDDNNQQIRATATRSMFAKAFADHLSHKLDLAHCKALLLDLFLCHLPEWVGSVIICDDNEKVNQSINTFKRILVAAAQEDQAASISTLVTVTVTAPTKTVPLTMIHVSSQHTEPKVYLQLLDEHLKKAKSA